MIMAQSEDGVIGPGLPWGRFREDMEWFVNRTKRKTCIVGRRTWEESVYKFANSGQYNRRFLVLGSKPPFVMYDNCDFASGDIMSILRETVDKEFIVIGGRNVYEQFLPIIDTLYLTIVNGFWQDEVCSPLIFDLSNWGKLENRLDYGFGRIEVRSR